MFTIQIKDINFDAKQVKLLQKQLKKSDSYTAHALYNALSIEQQEHLIMEYTNKELQFIDKLKKLCNDKNILLDQCAELYSQSKTPWNEVNTIQSRIKDIDRDINYEMSQCLTYKFGKNPDAIIDKILTEYREYAVKSSLKYKIINLFSKKPSSYQKLKQC